MDKYINATQLINVLDNILTDLKAEGNTKSFEDMCRYVVIRTTKRLLEEKTAASSEFRPVIHSHWIDYGSCVCANCGSRSIDAEEGTWCNDNDPIFCPYCGAIMDEPEE